MTADQIRSLQPALAALLATFRPCFKRTASFNHWERYIVGLITDLKRKSIEPIASAKTSLLEMLQVAFERWQVEQWFGRAKQEAGFGAFFSPHVHQPHSPLAILADGDVLLSRPGAAASGGKIRRSCLSR